MLRRRNVVPITARFDLADPRIKGRARHSRTGGGNLYVMSNAHDDAFAFFEVKEASRWPIPIAPATAVDPVVVEVETSPPPTDPTIPPAADFEVDA
jgi:hypothetical protein